MIQKNSLQVLALHSYILPCQVHFLLLHGQEEAGIPNSAILC